jgi:hypothetical protein
MSYKTTWVGDEGLYVRYSGQSSVQEVAEYGRDVQADPRFDDLRFVLNDFRACTSMAFDPLRVEALAASDRGASVTNPNICILVLTDSVEVKAFVDAYRAVGLQTFPIEVFSKVEDVEACANRLLARRATSPGARSLARLLRTSTHQ